jgi:hypothetical protein
MGQHYNGSTINATVSQSLSGVAYYSFADVYDMSFNLTNLTSANTIVGSATNDRFFLDASSGDTLNGGPGDDIFVIAPSQTSLNGDKIVGGSGTNFIQIGGPTATVDLAGTGASGVAAVVASYQELNPPTGEVVNVSISGIASTKLTSASGTAFVSLIGTSGVTNLTGPVGSPNGVTFVGELNAAGAGFTATGAAITGGALAALQGEATGYSTVAYDLDELYFGQGIAPSTVSYVQNHLNAYVFSSGGKDYTIWTDGAVTLNGSAAYYVAAPSAGAAITTSEAVPIFNSTNHADATLEDNAAGASSLYLGDGTTGAYGAIVLNKGVTGTIVHGDNGLNGGDYFGLGLSGGGNTIVGTSKGDQFDLGQSTSLMDVLEGSGGFNVITGPHSTDINLTSTNASTNGLASTGIDAVVGSGLTVQTVEVNLSNLAVTNLGGGVKTAYFEAYLGGTANTVTVTGGTLFGWTEVGTMAPGAALLPNATALTDASSLDAYWSKEGGSTTAKHDAATQLTGYLFEQVNTKAHTALYVTVWTDATVVDDLVPPAKPAAMAQAMAQMSASGANGAAHVAAASFAVPKLTLAVSHV